MKRALLLAVVSTAIIAGCGDSDQESSDAKADSASRPSEGFKTANAPAKPASFEKSKAEAAKADANDDYDFVHAHFFIPGDGACYDRPNGRGVDWAGEGVIRGYCEGDWKGGSPPFNPRPDATRYGGANTTWERLGERGLPRAVKSMPGTGDRVIKIAQVTSRYKNEPSLVTGERVECYIIDRSRTDCYTDYQRQKDKPAGQPGGPLSLHAEFPTVGDDFLLLRGFCRKGDDMCTPHL